jgi:hypothetical protein
VAVAAQAHSSSGCLPIKRFPTHFGSKRFYIFDSESEQTSQMAFIYSISESKKSGGNSVDAAQNNGVSTAVLRLLNGVPINNTLSLAAVHASCKSRLRATPTLSLNPLLAFQKNNKGTSLSPISLLLLLLLLLLLPSDSHRHISGRLALPLHVSLVISCVSWKPVSMRD